MELVSEKYGCNGKSQENEEKGRESGFVIIGQEFRELLGSFLGDFNLNILYPGLISSCTKWRTVSALQIVGNIK